MHSGSFEKQPLCDPGCAYAVVTRLTSNVDHTQDRLLLDTQDSACARQRTLILPGRLYVLCEQQKRPDGAEPGVGAPEVPRWPGDGGLLRAAVHGYPTAW